MAVISCALAAGISTMGVGAASAVEPDTSAVEVLPAGEPVPVSPTEFGYTATHDLTVRASRIDLAQFVASIPVPAQYRAANLALAARFDATVAEALKSPGGCVQVVVDPRATSGNLFNYGFFAIEGKYCD
ncbi:MAG: hypothetical protein JHC79_01115 [Williamsia sp.]|nr:hypothetical protein [Williamsia sp.]